MAIEEIQAVEYTCNGCGSTTLTRVGDPKPKGYYGTAELINEDGEWMGKFYACRKGCIHRAITAVTGARNGSAPVEEGDEGAKPDPNHTVSDIREELSR